MKIGRNQPCPCGSGQKYKRCCGNPLNKGKPRVIAPIDILERYRADEMIRQQQQGLGRPVISGKIKNQQFVVAGKTVYHSPKWKTFPDFLSDYLKMTLGVEWGNAEIAKPLHNRHTILKWYDEYCFYQRKYLQTPGEIVSSPMTGIVYCYLGLAYSLYLLKHNVELQDRLIKRLKNQANFQGAYYEIIVANSLIRAGFDLVLENEADNATKHCEFAAVSKKTGKRYWVEAKMRAVLGLLGKTENDGTKNSDPTSELIKHLNDSLRKPADADRLIFIDLNTDPCDDKKPVWVERACEKLDRRERDLDLNQSAYIFITNLPFHRRMQSKRIGQTILAYGLGISDFSKPGNYLLSEIYRRKQKHIDAHRIVESFSKYPQLPTTFDGSLPSNVKGNTYDRIIIGETYFFEGVGEGGQGIIGTVTSAAVDENNEIAYIGTSTGHIVTKTMSDDELEDYRNHPEAFWGKIQPSPRKRTENLYELFEFILDAYSETPKDKLLEFMKGAADFSSLEKMDQADLVVEYAERCCASVSIKFNTNETFD
jgi:hypothetical protein